MAISKKSALGVATEATAGTLMTSPTIYVPTKSMIKAKKKREYLMEERGDRNEEYDVVDTTRFGEWDVKGPFYPDANGYFLMAALGSVTTAQQGGTTAYKATYALADIPKTLSLFKSFDAQKYGLTYSVVEKFSIKIGGPDKLMVFDSSGKSIWPSKYAGTFTPVFSTVKALAGYAPTITLTSGATTDIDELEVTFEQKITLWTPANASQDWITAYFGARKVSFGFTARFDSDALYETYYRATNVNDTLTVDAKGQFIANQYLVTLGSPSAGTFTLTFNGQTTAGIAYNAASATVQTALQGLSSVGASNMTVTGSVGGPYTVTYAGTLAQSPLALTGSGAGLTGGTFSVAFNGYYNELNIVIPVTTYDDMEHDLGKDNVLIKAKGRGLGIGAGAGNNLIQMYTISPITSYAT